MHINWDWAVKHYRYIFLVFILLAVLTSIQLIMLGRKPENADRHPYFKYNNYEIFKQSYIHLVNGKNLYKAYPSEYEDLYKYSPTFALSFGIFNIFPDIVGLTLWNLLNVLLLFFAFKYLPDIDKRKKILMLLVITVELMTSIQNSQANGLIAGLVILTFGLLEKKHYFLACFCLMWTVYIKIFGLLTLVLFLFYPRKWQLALYTLLCAVLLFIFPLLAISFDDLQYHYHKWFELLLSDYSSSYGVSALGLVHAWFGVNINKMIFIFSGFVILILPYLNIRSYKAYSFRILALASLLIWMVIFNHKAESPTFIIAMSGVALWSLSFEIKKWKITMLACAILLTSLSTSDLFPVSFRDGVLVPYFIKVLPCIMIWISIICEMIMGRKFLSSNADPDAN